MARTRFFRRVVMSTVRNRERCERRLPRPSYEDEALRVASTELQKVRGWRATCGARCGRNTCMRVPRRIRFTASDRALVHWGTACYARRQTLRHRLESEEKYRSTRAEAHTVQGEASAQTSSAKATRGQKEAGAHQASDIERGAHRTNLQQHPRGTFEWGARQHAPRRESSAEAHERRATASSTEACGEMKQYDKTEAWCYASRFSIFRSLWLTP